MVNRQYFFDFFLKFMDCFVASLIAMTFSINYWISLVRASLSFLKEESLGFMATTWRR